MDKIKTKTGQGLGVAGLVLGILCVFLAFIPCVGAMASGPGFIAIVLSTIGLIKANKNNGAKGINIAALIISIIGTVIACLWFFVFVCSSWINEDQVKDFFDEMMGETNACNAVLQDVPIVHQNLVDSVKFNEVIEVQSDSGKIKILSEKE